MKDGRWTAEEYREYLRTGREPDRRSAVSPTCCQKARPSGVSLDGMEDELIRQHGGTVLSRTPNEYGRQDVVIAWTDPEKGPDAGNEAGRTENAADSEGKNAEMTTFDRLSRRVSAYAAQEYMKKRGVTDAEIVLPEDRPKKKRKYRNEPVTVDGIRFDSKHEAAAYQDLQLRVKSGELRNVLLQVPFLLPGGIKYVADFVTLTPDFRIEGVYDAKSEITRKNRVYINKKKQMKACWGIEIKEV